MLFMFHQADRGGKQTSRNSSRTHVLPDEISTMSAERKLSQIRRHELVSIDNVYSSSHGSTVALEHCAPGDKHALSACGGRER